jgi:hypothetical protein
MTMQVPASTPFLPSADLASEYCIEAFRRAILLLFDVLASAARTPSSRAPTTVSLSVVH